MAGSLVLVGGAVVDAVTGAVDWPVAGDVAMVAAVGIGVVLVVDGWLLASFGSGLTASSVSIGCFIY